MIYEYSHRYYPRNIITSVLTFHAIPCKLGWKTWITHPVFLYPVLEFNSHDCINYIYMNMKD